MTTCLHRLIVLLFAVALPFVASAADFVVVLDPGHGGKDAGAVGKNSKEKDIVLDIAKRVGDKLKDNKSIEVIYTRKTDKFVALPQRVRIANNAKCNLFVSIHVNSLPKENAKRGNMRGISVWTAGAKTKNNELVNRENGGIDPDTDFGGVSADDIMFREMNASWITKQSIDFAYVVNSCLKTASGRRSEGLRQGNFYVLKFTTMPAILAELDYICNPTVETYLNSTKGREQLATGIYNAIVKYAEPYINANDLKKDKTAAPKNKKSKKSKKK